MNLIIKTWLQFSGITSKTPFHSEVIQILASTASGAQLAYSLHNIRFSRGDRGEENLVYFIIDRDTGTIYTNLPHYRQFLHGHFDMFVDISKDGASYATALVKVTQFIHIHISLHFYAYIICFCFIQEIVVLYIIILQSFFIGGRY